MKIRETFIESLSQACAKKISVNLHITSCKMENGPPLLLLIRKFGEESNLLESKQLQALEPGFDSRRTGATYFAQGLNPLPQICAERVNG